MSTLQTSTSTGYRSSTARGRSSESGASRAPARAASTAPRASVSTPTTISTWPTNLNNRVQVFSREGVLQRAWGGPGDGPGQLDLPWGVAVDTERNVFVADWGNDRVQKFSPDGRVLASFGSSGQGDGQFDRPSCVAVDAEGVLYVSDWGNERVPVLAPGGGFIEKLRGEATPSKWADEFFEANPDEAAARARSNITPSLDPEVDTAYEESARTEPYFWGPVSVKLDSHRRLYVTETNRHRIQVYETV